MPTSIRSSPTRRRGAGQGHPDGERQQPVRRRDDEGPRGLRRSSYALNSRLVKQDGKLVEEVYRVGGRYGAQIARRSSATSRRRFRSRPSRWPDALRALITFYQTGETADREAYDIAWVAGQGVAGRHDQRLHRGLPRPARHQGRVGSAGLLRQPGEDRADPEARRPTRSGSRTACRGTPKYRKPGVQRHHRQRHRRRHRDRRLGSDHAGRHQPAERSDDPRAVRQQVGVAVERQRGLRQVDRCRSSAREFSWTPEEAERAEKWSSFAGELTTNMHEVIGHASGRIAERLQGQSAGGAQGAVLGARGGARRSRRRSTSCPIRSSSSSGSSPAADHDEIVRAEYEAYARNALVQLRRVREGTQIEEDHMRNRQMIVGWLMANTKAIEVARRATARPIYVMVDAEGVPRGVGRLLAEVQRIKAEGDYAGGAEAVRDLRRALRSGAARRDRRPRGHLQLPSYTGFVQPLADGGHRRRRRDHGRDDLVSDGPDDADARILGPAKVAIVRSQQASRRRVCRSLMAGVAGLAAAVGAQTGARPPRG